MGARTEVSTSLLPWLEPSTVIAVLGTPALWHVGLLFSVPTLGILLCHELGHYLACRHHGLPATLPYFLPAPIGVGTFGAFIRIRGPILSKRQLLDVGVAGPLAGFGALLPVLAFGIAWSSPTPLHAVPESEAVAWLTRPGASLLSWGLTAAFHGRLPAGTVLDPHPFVIAAWVGLFATMLNLLPLGQLDGGHILYAALGARQRRLAWPLWGLVALAGLLWLGWLFWAAVTLAMGVRHPPVVDESEALDPRRRLLAWLALAVFVLSFMPIPISIEPIGP